MPERIVDTSGTWSSAVDRWRRASRPRSSGVPALLRVPRPVSARRDTGTDHADRLLGNGPRQLCRHADRDVPLHLLLRAEAGGQGSARWTVSMKKSPMPLITEDPPNRSSNLVRLLKT